MSRLLAAKTCAHFTHSFQNISVSDLSLLHVNTVLFSHQEKSEITHDCGNDRIQFQFPLSFHVAADNRHYLIAVHNFAVFIYSQQSVRIAVKSKTQIGFLINDSRLQLLHMG